MWGPEQAVAVITIPRTKVKLNEVNLPLQEPSTVDSKELNEMSERQPPSQ